MVAVPRPQPIWGLDPSRQPRLRMCRRWGSPRKFCASVKHTRLARESIKASAAAMCDPAPRLNARKLNAVSWPRRRASARKTIEQRPHTRLLSHWPIKPAAGASPAANFTAGRDAAAPRSTEDRDRRAAEERGHAAGERRRCRLAQAGLRAAWPRRSCKHAPRYRHGLRGPCFRIDLHHGGR